MYNVCRGVDPGCYQPWVTTRQNRVLIYSRTTGPRHAANGTILEDGLNPPLASNNVMQRALIDWLAVQGVDADWTEDVSHFTNLNNYKAVIFANTSRDALFKHGTVVGPQAVNTSNSAQLDSARTALMQYVRAGGGVVMLHNALATEYQWPYFTGLAGAAYYDHAAFQEGTVYSGYQDSSLEGIPTTWRFKDEFYNYYPYPERVKFVLMVDETSLATRTSSHPGHGTLHPMAWCQYYDGGRSFSILLGHDTQAWQDGSGVPGQEHFKRFVVQAILATMGNRPFCTS